MPRYRYHQSDKLGSGSFGVVYGCCEIDEGDGVVEDGLAIKFLKDEWLDDDEYRERFRTEARLLRRLKHPNVLPVVYSNLSGERPYIVMPRGETNLADVLETQARDRPWRLDLLRVLLTAVAYAHEQNVLHRDLKPANVLFVNDEPMVSDFGMGKNIAPDATQKTLTNSPIGTLNYMAPEQWSEPRNARKPADVYSLGKILWELLANRQPRPWAPDLSLVDDETLRGYIERCCEDEPSLRFRDAGEALRAWDALVGELGPARSPLDQAHELTEEWARTPVGPDIKVVRRLDGLFRRFADEEQLYFDIVPYLTPQLIEQYAKNLPGDFERMFRTYLGHISGGLPFDYCDEVAHLCACVFECSPNPDVRWLAFQKMLAVGARHNRYPVADQVRELLWGIKDEASAELAASVVADEPTAIWYHHWQLFRKSLPPQVKDAFDKLLVPQADDDIPF